MATKKKSSKKSKKSPKVKKAKKAGKKKTVRASARTVRKAAKPRGTASRVAAGHSEPERLDWQEPSDEHETNTEFSEDDIPPEYGGSE